MATKQRIAIGYPYPVYVNETSTSQRTAIGSRSVNEKANTPATATASSSTQMLMGV